MSGDQVDLKEIRGDVVRRHPWESSRLSFFKNVLGNYGSKQVSTILDIGSGDAFFAQEIHKAFFPKAKLICFDLNYTEEKRYGLIQFTKTRPSERFDLFLMMDVLEHAERDEEFLEEIVKKNSKGTSLFLISVPAWQKLYTLHDKKLGHFRRYSFNQFEKLLNEAGLEVVLSGGLFHGLLLPRLMTKIQEKKLGESHSPLTKDLGEWKGGYCLTRFLECLLYLDNTFSLLMATAGIKIPGLSVWCLARRKS